MLGVSRPRPAPGFHGRHGRGRLCDNACNHIDAATIYIDWNLSPTNRQLIMRHELGHALGLGHNDAEHGSVMHKPIYYPTATSHDWYAMYLEMYTSTTEPAQKFVQLTPAGWFSSTGTATQADPC